MTSTTPEVERKFEAEVGFSPDLAHLVRPGPAVTHRLVATYLDTVTLALTRAGWSLRRRTGGRDDGWHLKQPRADGPGRLETAAALSATLPDALRTLAHPVVGPHALVPVAVLATARTEVPLSSPGDGLVAQLADDDVAATVGATVLAWHELEIELEPGVEAAWLDRLSDALLRSGARPAAHASKVARALALVTPVGPVDHPGAPAGDVLLAYLSRQVGTLQAWDAGVRADTPDAVHKSRVATRRLRSVLGTYGRLFDRARTEPLRAELRWLAGMLGAPRDAEVLREEFGDLLAELGPDGVPASVRRRLTGHLTRRHDEAHTALLAALEGPRAVALRAELERLLLEPPLRQAAGAAASEALPPLVARAVARVASLQRAALARPDDLERWHAIRKAAKAVRYCLEAVSDALGPDCVARADRWTEVTEEFGVLQDTVVADDLLDHLAVAAAASGEPVDAWRVLRDIQHDRRAAALVAGRRALGEALAHEG